MPTCHFLTTMVTTGNRATTFLLLLFTVLIGRSNARAVGNYSNGGMWQLLFNNSGVVAMHMALTHQDTVVIFDQTSAGSSRFRLHGCRGRSDCSAHSVEYTVSTNTLRPLRLRTDTWCSSGAFLRGGTLLQTGGHGDGGRKVRRFRPCSDGQCGWNESRALLAEQRWYATDQVLPEGNRVFVIGGLNAFTYEFAPKLSNDEGAFRLPFLHETQSRQEHGDNLYPFVHLSPDGHLFIFANRDSILLDYGKHRVVKRFPRMPGGGARNYPSTGSSAMLPLEHGDEFHRAEVMVCGGAAPGAYQAARSRRFLHGLRSCGRLVITDDSPSWAMEQMPGRRLMADMLLLPTGDVLIINGAKRGCAGWGNARRPSYHPYLYETRKAVGSRFSTLNPSGIPRMYHSSAIVLPDGRILVAGSNPYRRYTFRGRYPTELRVEAFTPYYMDSSYDDKRATNVTIDKGSIQYGDNFVVRFAVGEGLAPGLEFCVYAPPFATHSLSMGQRMLKLQCSSVEHGSGGEVRAMVVAPPSPVVAPSGYYLLTVVNGGIPSKAQWVRFVQG